MMLNFKSVKKILLTIFVMLVAVQVFAQKSTITGVVKDSEGKPIVGATVQEKGLTNTTITDPEGKFSLQSHNGISIIIKMKGYYTQEIKLSNGIDNIGEIVLVEIHRWEFGVLAGLNNTTGSPTQFYRMGGSDNKTWENHYYIRFDESKLDFNAGANIFFYPGKGVSKMQTLLGLSLAYYSKRISSSDNIFGDFLDDIEGRMYRLHYDYGYTLKQNINTIDISFLIKHKVLVKKSGICIMYGPIYGVVINDDYNLTFGEYSEFEYENDVLVGTNNNFSESQSGIIESEVKREFNQLYGYKYALGGVGAIGFEHSSGFGIWGTFTIKYYRNQYDKWCLYVPKIGGVLSYRF